MQLFLKPNHYAAFRIGVLTPDTEGIFIAESFVQTQFEQIKIPFRLRTADGSLSVVPNTIVFHNSFPVSDATDIPLPVQYMKLCEWVIGYYNTKIIVIFFEFKVIRMLK